jgi:transcriptional regulator with XRE-family HTH domain
VFYDKFAYLCKLKGVSPSRAAIDAGISKSLVTKWKTNRTEVPSPEVLVKLASYFSVTVSDLLEETGETEISPSQRTWTEREIRLLEAISSLSPERQKALADLLGISLQ